MYSWKALTEQEALGLWPKGDYVFEVKNLKHKPSKAGRMMVEVELLIHSMNAQIRVFDYLSEEFMAFKHRHFIIGMFNEDFYNKQEGDLSLCVGRRGMLKLGVQEAKDGYQAKNVVLDYYKDKDKLEQSKPEPEFDNNSDLPF